LFSRPKKIYEPPLCDSCNHQVFLHFEGKCHNVVQTPNWLKYPSGCHLEYDEPPCECPRTYDCNEDFMQYFKYLYPDIDDDKALSSYAHYKGNIKVIEKMQREMK